MRWVTWEHIGVDRMACAWLIRRFIDPEAELIFVPANSQPLPEGAEPFDIPGTRLSHYKGHCSFHTMLREYRLDDPVLHRMARIIDEADIVQDVAIEPVAPGLDFICRGLRLICSDDHEAVERSHYIYEGLYAKLSGPGNR